MHECIYNHTFNLLLKEVMRATSSALSDLIKDINNTVTIDEGELNKWNYQPAKFLLCGDYNVA